MAANANSTQHLEKRIILKPEQRAIPSPRKQAR
jgi:hypothetical protein